MLRAHRDPVAVLVFPDSQTAQMYDRVLKFAKEMIEKEQDAMIAVGTNPESAYMTKLSEARAGLYELRIQIGIIQKSKEKD